MNQVSHSKVLITGSEGFTGIHLSQFLIQQGFEVVGLKSDLVDRNKILEEIQAVNPDYVIHLAAISFAATSNSELLYQVNVQGTINLLDALCQLDKPIKKVILASSATVYGNVTNTVLNEELCPKPVNHYGCSKLSMEHMSQNYIDKLPLIITRPFNYTGVGHDECFLIPKIVKAYQDRFDEIELGNLDVSREFNDIRDVCRIYSQLLIVDKEYEVVNICSGKAISLMDVISSMNKIAGYEINVKVNQEFVRENEIKSLSGDNSKLSELVEVSFLYPIEDTLSWMYRSNK